VLEIAEYIALDKPGAADRWADSTFQVAGRLESHPKSGRIVPEMGRSEVREIIHGAYRIIYRIETERVLVLTIRASRQRFDSSEAE
jgi:plasmid stabilization system protein ParE